MESALCVLTAEPRASRVSGVASLESWCVKGRDATVVGYEWAGLSMPARFPVPRQQQPIYGFAPQFARDNLKNQIILPFSARRPKKTTFGPKPNLPTKTVRRTARSALQLSTESGH